MADKETKIFINHIDKFDPWKDAIKYTEEDKKRFLDLLVASVEPSVLLKNAINKLSEEDQQKFKEILDKIIKNIMDDR